MGWVGALAKNNRKVGAVMSKVAVIPSPRTPSAKWMPEILTGLRAARVHGLDTVAVLGDSVPATASWVSNPTRQNSGLIFTGVTTRWDAANAVRERNEALLGDTDAVVVLGYVSTKSSAHALSRAFMNPKITVVQVIDGTATMVGAKSIQTAPGYEIPVVVERPSEADGWSEFANPAPTTKTKK